MAESSVGRSKNTIVGGRGEEAIVGDRCSHRSLSSVSFVRFAIDGVLRRALACDDAKGEFFHPGGLSMTRHLSMKNLSIT